MSRFFCANSVTRFLGVRFFKKESEVEEQAKEYLDAADRCVATAETAVVACLNGELAQATAADRQSAELANTADSHRDAVTDRLFAGAYLPLIRGDIFSVVESLNKVPDATRACCNFFLSERPQVPTELRNSFIEIAAESFGAIKDLHKAACSLFNPNGETETIRSCIREVENRGSRVGSMERDLEASIFKCGEIDLSHQCHLATSLNRIVRVSEVAGEAAQCLELTAMKSVL